MYTRCAHKRGHKSELRALKQKSLQIPTLDVGGSQKSKNKYLVNSPFKEAIPVLTNMTILKLREQKKPP